MELRISFALLRVVVLAAFAVLLGGLLCRRMSTPAFAATDSPANGVHLIPNDHDQLVVLDTRTHRLLTFSVVNGGTEVRLRGWRDLSDDGRMWDTSLLKAANFPGIETVNGATTQTLRPDPKNATNMLAAQADQLKLYKLKLVGPAAAEVAAPAVP